MNIVVTDGATLNPGDLSWDELSKFGQLQVYDVSSYEENIKRCKDAEITITNKVVFDKATIEKLPKLKMISVTATGYNIIDIKAAKEKGIIVTNVPTYGTSSVSQMVFALLLELTQHVGHHSRTVHEGKWSACPDFCYWDFPLIELAGLTMGIIGLGRIGQSTANIAKAFGMKVLAYDIMEINASDGIEVADIETIFKQSDCISLHCPLTAETEGIVNSKNINLMKESAILINTSRGPLVNEQDLSDALNSYRIAGAGVDVLSSEPPKTDNPLLTAKNCYITPHIAWATKSARYRLLNTTIANVKAFIDGKPQNVVS